MIFLQKKRDSKRNLFLKLKNIICYYQTILIPESFSSAKIFQNIICYYQTWRIQICDYQHTDFKTSYVITKLFFGYTINTAFTNFKTSYVITKHKLLECGAIIEGFQNIICYYQTSTIFRYFIFFHISKHHMLLPNKANTLLSAVTLEFQNIICYYQTHGFKPSFNPLIPWKPLNHGILFKFYQPTPNFRNDS